MHSIEDSKRTMIGHWQHLESAVHLQEGDQVGWDEAQRRLIGGHLASWR